MLVSECFRHHLKSLYLTEYPCHPKPTRVNTADGENEHPMYEVERLLDLIRDKKSPWHELAEWTRNAESIRESYIRDSNQINLDFVENYFSSLRFNDLQITTIDRNVSNFVNLNELILTCNQIEDCDSSNLPTLLNILDLTGNYLNDLKNLKKKPMINLQHLGLAYNWIHDVHGCFEYTNWPSLTSLDLSCNQFTDLVGLTNSLLGLKKLKVLMLYGNPIVLLPGYRGYIINSFDDNNIHLFALDDKVINREERINCQDFKQFGDKINKEAVINIEIKRVRNFPLKEQAEIDEAATEVSVTKYLLKILLIDDNYREKNDQKRQKLHSMNYKNQIWKRQQTYKLKFEEMEECEPSDLINLEEKGELSFRIKSLKQLRDFVLDGTEVELVERKKHYKTREQSQSESVLSFTKAKDAKSKDTKDAGKDVKKKVDPKASKAKKKTQAEALESFILIRVEDKCLARFDLELSSLLDGQCKEVKKDFDYKIKLEGFDLPKGIGEKSLGSIKEQEKAKKEKAGKKSATTKQNDAHDPDADKIQIELDVKFQLLDFQELKQLKSYFS